MPQMAPLMWLLLFMVFLFFIYFLMNFVFFTCAPKKFSKMTNNIFCPNMPWKW
uniref:ATP synthase F0 subunit 8 n=1 Tax=Pseudoniphargus portosancti TaxID=2056019 RepID=A0A345UE05_9CRUS|nr:ATP synthase F0 subunit 8 [Pseudoniphargus portosancti]